MKSSIWRLPVFDESAADGASENRDLNELPALDLVCELDTQKYDQDVKVTCFHPTESSKFSSVLENRFLIWDLKSGSNPKVILSFKVIIRAIYLSNTSLCNNFFNIFSPYLYI